MSLVPLCWVHVGDLHLTTPDQDNYRDFLAIIDEVNAHMRLGVDFVVLPGDNADDGTEEQFQLVRTGLDRLTLPCHILTGDHDFKPGRLDNFYQVLRARPLPYATRISGHRCLFLDMVSPGRGGPDFRLGNEQLAWLEAELDDAQAQGERVVVFMHAYPADLAEGGEIVTALFARHRVAVVDMGHTHYNELGNDGHTIFAATRSTGQIEEGPPGFSVIAVDGDAVSWRFKPIGEPWPLVMLTSPADRRLARGGRRVFGTIEVRALAWSRVGIASAACSIDGGPWQPMTQHYAASWSRIVDVPEGAEQIDLRVIDQSGKPGMDTISIAPPENEGEAVDHQGSDVHSIGAWHERHIFGTQLGPNRNGRAW